MANWEISLGGEWRAMSDDEVRILEEMMSKRMETMEFQLRRQPYRFDLVKMTQVNVKTNKSRKIRNRSNTNLSNASREGASYGIPKGIRGMHSLAENDVEIVEVWLMGEWKKLGDYESRQIQRQRDAGQENFQIIRKGVPYDIDLIQMTYTNSKTNRQRTIRFASAAASAAVGFDKFRAEFHKLFGDGKMTDQKLINSWPKHAEGANSLLLSSTAANVFAHMQLRGEKQVDILEWNHYWAMERDSPSFHAGMEVNEKLQEALQKDPQVLGRMQMHYETSLVETGAEHGLSSEGLLKACKRLVAGRKDTLEHQWASEVLKKESDGESELADDDADLSYYDFLNVMLGRKRFKVSLWKYDISDGAARRWAWLLLGHHFEGIWHTGVVVEWPDKAVEFWFGGRLFASQPGTTPFGTPLEKVPMGYTYKLHQDVWDHLAKYLASEFNSDNYDVLTHNCNHFSDKLMMFLRNEHIPNDVRMQPETAMNTITARALRPMLNRWLGGFDDKTGGDATDGGAAARELWEMVLPGAIVAFSPVELGRPIVGEVTDVMDDGCAVNCLNFWSGEVEDRFVPPMLVNKLINPAPEGTERPVPREIRMGSSGFFSLCCF